MRHLLWLVIPLVAFVLMIPGCHEKPFEVMNLSKAEANAGDIGDRVGVASKAVSGTATEIRDTATQGQQATPVPVRPTLDPYWSRIITNAGVLLQQGTSLDQVQKDIEKLRADIQKGQQDLAEAVSAVKTEKEARAKDKEEADKKLAAARSETQKNLQRISFLAAAAIGISVAFGVIMHDLRWSIAGGAGGFATILACMVLGQIDQWLPYILGGVAGVVVLWVGIESLIRGSFWAAIKSSPLQDLKDLSNNPVPTVSTVPKET